MFSLVFGFWNWFTQKKELRFLIVGIDNAGKTTTLERIKQIYNSKTPQAALDRITPTIGLNLCHVTFDRTWTGVFWDLGGQLMLRGIWENHYRECNGIIFVVDSTDALRLAEVRSTFESVVNHPALYNKRVPVVILINKQDVKQQARSVDYVIRAMSLEPHISVATVLDYPLCSSGSPKGERLTASTAASGTPSAPRMSCRSATSTTSNAQPPFKVTDVPTKFSISSGSSFTVSSSSCSSPVEATTLRAGCFPANQSVRIVCVAGCSAIKNVNISPALSILFDNARNSAALL